MLHKQKFVREIDYDNNVVNKCNINSQALDKVKIKEKENFQNSKD